MPCFVARCKLVVLMPHQAEDRQRHQSQIMATAMCASRVEIWFIAATHAMCNPVPDACRVSVSPNNALIVLCVQLCVPAQISGPEYWLNSLRRSGTAVFNMYCTYLHDFPYLRYIACSLQPVPTHPSSYAMRG